MKTTKNTAISAENCKITNVSEAATIIDRATTVAFTGYRSDKIFRSSNNPKITVEIQDHLDRVIHQLYHQGYRTFISGMAEGFDLISANMVRHVKEELTDIQLIAAVPYPKQSVAYDPLSGHYYNSCLCMAVHVFVISPDYDKGCFFRRNDFMLNNCSKVVCYYDGQPGGQDTPPQKPWK